jgi:H+/Cl- antiporter ClcA
VFAVEIVQKSEMRYRDLFPAILSSSTAVFISKAFGWQSFYPINAAPEFMSPGLLWVLILFALLIGFAGKAFTALYILLARIFKREKNEYILLKVLAGSAIAGFGIWFLNPELMGTSKNIIAALFEPDIGLLYGNLPHSIPLFVTLAVMAAAILTIESFGLQYSFPAGIAAIIAFQVNRHDTIYSYSGYK